MRVVLPLVALFLAGGASAEPPIQTQRPELMPTPVVDPSAPNAVCRDRIMEVRRELGQPPLPRGRAEDPLFIAAVDKRVAGCSVLVMRNDTSDIRPLPTPQEHRLMPAR